MDIYENWDLIRSHFRRSFSSSLHVSIASVGSDNIPCVSPIGSMFLNKDQTGFYFEKYPSTLPIHADENKNICVLGVNSGKWFWFKSLLNKKFDSHPAIKLYGSLGAKRKASEEELRGLKRRMRFTRRLKGHKYLWTEMKNVRELKFTRAEKISFGKMTRDNL